MAQASVASRNPHVANGHDIAFAVGILTILPIFFLPIPVFVIDLGLALAMLSPWRNLPSPS